MNETRAEVSDSPFGTSAGLPFCVLGGGSKSLQSRSPATTQNNLLRRSCRAMYSLFLPCTTLSPILKSQRVPHGSGYTHVSSCDRRNLPRFPIPRRARHLYLLHAIYSGRYIKGDHATNSRLRRSHGLQGRYLYRRYDARRVHGGEALSDG